MARVIVPRAEAILDRKFPVLDHGFVRQATALEEMKELSWRHGCEVSGRYSVMPDEFCLPAVGQIRKQGKRNNQGSASEELSLYLRERVLEILRSDQATTCESCKRLLRADTARELARIDLIPERCTRLNWRSTCAVFFHFLRLRLDAYAQHEVSEYAKVMAEMTKAVAPIAFEVLEEYVLYAWLLSKSSKDRLQARLQSLATKSLEAADILRELGQ